MASRTDTQAITLRVNNMGIGEQAEITIKQTRNDLRLILMLPRKPALSIHKIYSDPAGLEITMLGKEPAMFTGYPCQASTLDDFDIVTFEWYLRPAGEREPPQ